MCTRGEEHNINYMRISNFNLETSNNFQLETEANTPLRVTWLTGMPNCKEELSYEVYFDQYDRYVCQE